MSNARYIWSVANALRSRVRPQVTENAARDALDNGIRVLTTIANALEPGPDVPEALRTEGVADTDRLGGPAENVAAYRTTGTAIARLATDLDKGAKPAALQQKRPERQGDPAYADARAAIRDYLAAQLLGEATLIHPAFEDKGPRR